jgi:hypothetical protein
MWTCKECRTGGPRACGKQAAKIGYFNISFHAIPLVIMRLLHIHWRPFSDRGLGPQRSAYSIVAVVFKTHVNFLHVTGCIHSSCTGVSTFQSFEASCFGRPASQWPGEQFMSLVQAF